MNFFKKPNIQVTLKQELLNFTKSPYRKQVINKYKIDRKIVNNKQTSKQTKR